MKRKISILLTLILIITTIPFAAFAADETVVEIQILGTSDLHGRIYPYEYATDSADADAGLAKISTVVNQLRTENPNSILFDCGDTLQDNSSELFNDLPVHPMIQAMNMIGYDAWVLGNHEFNFSMDFLNKNIAGFEGKTLSSNIYKEGTTERFVAPYEIFEVQGVRVAVVGMMPPNVPLWEASTPDHFKGLVFTDVVKETEKVVKELEGKYDVLVGAYHVGPEGEHGYDGIEIVAAQFPQFDVIYGGHAHSQYTKEINGVQLIEPGRYGWAVGQTKISVAKENDKWVVKTVATANVGTAKVDADQKIIDAFKFVHDQSLANANMVVGQISADFIKSPDYFTGEAKVTTLPTSQIMDTPVIDLINEVQMYYSKADISSAALFKTDSNLKKGVFKKKDVAFIYMYDNTLMGVNITGENLLKYMEWSANYYNTYTEGDLTISFNPTIRGYNYDMFSGVDYKIDISKPEGSRIVDVLFNGKPIELKKVYKLAVNNYRFGTLIGLDLVKPSDKYYDSFEAMADKGRVRDLIIAYTADVKKGQLDPTLDNNWSIIGTKIENSPYLPMVKEMIKNGTILLPTSEDGRTPNVKAININDLLKDGTVKSMTYTVVSGDVLWRIAQKYQTTWQALSELNQMKNPHLIMPGQLLLVPTY